MLLPTGAHVNKYKLEIYIYLLHDKPLCTTNLYNDIYIYNVLFLSFKYLQYYFSPLGFYFFFVLCFFSKYHSSIFAIVILASSEIWTIIFFLPFCYYSASTCIGNYLYIYRNGKDIVFLKKDGRWQSPFRQSPFWSTHYISMKSKQHDWVRMIVNIIFWQQILIISLKSDFSQLPAEWIIDSIPCIHLFHFSKIRKLF